MSRVEIRPITAADVEPIVAAFAALGWPGKDAELYERYLAEHASGERHTLVGSVDGDFAGYVTVNWVSSYPPFRASGIPEIQDLNVLMHFRRRGVATGLLDAAEGLIAERGDVAGIGVGLYSDYGAAQILYARRGYVPDGRGVTYDSQIVAPGAYVRVDDDLVLMMSRRIRDLGPKEDDRR